MIQVSAKCCSDDEEVSLLFIYTLGDAVCLMLHSPTCKMVMAHKDMNLNSDSFFLIAGLFLGFLIRSRLPAELDISSVFVF